MKPWVIRVFDPRPPAWHILLLVVLFLCSVVVVWEISFTAGRNASMNGTASLTGNSPTDETKDLVVEWSIVFSRHEYVDTTTIGPPVIQFANQWPSGTPIANPVEFLYSDDPRAVDIRNQLEPISLPWRGSVRDLFGWHRKSYDDMKMELAGGTVSRSFVWIRFVFWTSCMVVGFTVIVLLGRVVTFCVVSNRYWKIQKEICPTCLYSHADNQFERCPECGLDLIEFDKLYSALYLRGYRGLKELRATK